MLQVEIIHTEELGDRSYVVHDGADAVVIDPQRDVDRVEAVLDRHALTLQAVLETHVHNDYVTGGLALARRTGARYLLSADDEVGFEREPLRDGDEFEAGTVMVRAVSTPGHTPAHLAYVISDRASTEAAPAVFTGGSLLYGSVGRTDLVAASATRGLTRAQYASARRLAGVLPDDAAVYPTHGFGSFCSAGPATGGDASTIGIEKVRNDALVEADEDVFVERLLAGLLPYPAYYAHMAPLNRRGPCAPDLSPATPMDPAEVRDRIAAGEWVVDLRSRVAYAGAHVHGTIGIELGTQFATYLGWLLPWGSPLTLLGATPQQVAGAQRQLVRIGIDRLAGAAVGTPRQLAGGGEPGSYERANFADLAARLARAPSDEPLVVLDVRRDDEYAESSIPGSVHVPLYGLLDRLDAVPRGEVWVHCAAGFRASIGASLLRRAGRHVVLVDDDFEIALVLGLAR